MSLGCAANGAADCTICHVGRHSDWFGLDEAGKAVLARGVTRRDYGSGEAVFVQGAPNDGVHCVFSGVVAIRRLDEDGRSVLLSLAYPGDTLGYRSFVAGGEHKTSAEAVGPTAVCHVDRATVRVLLTASPLVGLRFLSRSIAEVERAHERLVRQATLSHRAQLVHLLLLMADRHGRPGDNGDRTIDLPLSRRDLASMIGTRHETVSRIIGRLEEEGLAYFSGRQVTVPNVATLAAEIERAMLA